MDVWGKEVHRERLTIDCSTAGESHYLIDEGISRALRDNPLWVVILSEKRQLQD